ncbi:MAG TPA: hypothetical protein VLB89_09990 [Gaiellaceae bacterium]|nr:hypothetical protein [Gaiellaceae bacterium]
MTKRTSLTFLAAAAVAALVALAWTFAAAAPASASKSTVIPIVMKDPGCHWFRVAGKDRVKLTVHGTTAFRNLDEATVIVKGSKATQRVAVGKTFTVTQPGVYRITMVGQHPDDNHLVLTVK